LNIKYFYVVY